MRYILGFPVDFWLGISVMSGAYFSLAAGRDLIKSGDKFFGFLVVGSAANLAVSGMALMSSAVEEKSF